MSRMCYWNYDDVNDVWKTECDRSISLPGTSPGKDMKYCPFCGGKLIEITENGDLITNGTTIKNN